MESDYLIRKKPMQALLIFSLPIILGNLFQQTYTMADSAILGRFVSEQRAAAVLFGGPKEQRYRRTHRREPGDESGLRPAYRRPNGAGFCYH